MVVMGLPGAGKSTVARTIAHDFPFYYAAADNIRLSFCPNPDFCSIENKETYTTMYAVVRELLENGESVIMDGTMTKKIYRTELKEIFSHIAEMFLVFVDADSERIVERLKNRKQDFSDPFRIQFGGDEHLLERFEQELEKPSTDEFNDFFQIENNSDRPLSEVLASVYSSLQQRL